MLLPDSVKTVADRLSAARLTVEEDNVRRHILQIFASGAIPEVSSLQNHCGLSSVRVREILRRLTDLDLCFLDQTVETVLGSYPFSATPTPHRVLLAGREVFALCAVDALGIPAMLQESAGISSRCAHCESPVEVRAEPENLARYLPSGIVVWFPTPEEDNCCSVAQSRCPHISFFCTGDHLEAWQRGHGEPSGVVLSLLEAFEAGREIFGSLLVEPEPPMR
ncbi:MAG: alkylmercury lyase family protein [Candidatus Methylomirabilales bacterium]